MKLVTKIGAVCVLSLSVSSFVKSLTCNDVIKKVYAGILSMKNPTISEINNEFLNKIMQESRMAQYCHKQGHSSICRQYFAVCIEYEKQMIRQLHGAPQDEQPILALEAVLKSAADNKILSENEVDKELAVHKKLGQQNVQALCDAAPGSIRWYLRHKISRLKQLDGLKALAEKSGPRGGY